MTVVLPQATGGGAERVSILLANELAQRGNSVTVVLVYKMGPLLELIDPAVQVVTLRRHRSGLVRIWELARVLRRVNPKTIVSAMVGVNIATLLAAKLAMIKAKIIVTEHNQTDRNFAVAKSGKARLGFRLIRFVYPMADRIVCVSQGVLEALVAFSGIGPDRLRVVHNPIVSPDLPALAREDCPHPWFNEDVPVVLAIGRMVEAKDFEMLLRAFALLREQRQCRLVVLGRGDQRDRLADIVVELSLQDCVDMPGFAQNPYSYLSRASVFALSSAWEGFPTVLVEALACGVPIVATDCPSGPREILEDGALGALTPVGDAEAFATALDSAIGQNGRECRVARGMQFTVARAVGQYEHLIDEIHGTRN